MKKKISIIGLGYVGLVSAVCFSKLGNKVIGVDINKKKVRLIKHKKNPLPVINKMGEYIKKYPLTIYNSHKKAVQDSDITFVCVETPCNRDGSLNLSALKKVCNSIGTALKHKLYHIVVIRSTMFPGSYEKIKRELEKSSGKKEGIDFYLVTNPEFLREINAIDDFFDPCYIVVGARNEKVGNKILECYNGVNAKKFVVNNDIAQMIKYVNNSWHGCKVSFTNEIGNLCKSLGIDGDKLMKLFCEDNKLNISKYYHKIGGPYGGHCLPKEISVLQDNSKRLGLKSHLINSISKSNEEHKKIFSKNKS